jgi:protein-disulfide isomerase
MRRTVPFIIIAGVLGFALLTTMYLKERPAAKTALSIPSSTSPPSTHPSSIKLGADPPNSLGTPEAPVMIEEFGDFECSPCGLLHPILKTMESEFGSRLVIVFREFPIASKHKHALAAASAAEAAGRQGKFWEMHDLLYENQNEWHDASDVGPIFEAYALRIGLRLDEFRRDVSSEIVDRRIALDKERGYSIGINSTPTVFLNGREVPLESLESAKLRELIRAEIISAGG